VIGVCGLICTKRNNARSACRGSCVDWKGGGSRGEKSKNRHRTEKKRGKKKTDCKRGGRLQLKNGTKKTQGTTRGTISGIEGWSSEDKRVSKKGRKGCKILGKKNLKKSKKKKRKSRPKANSGARRKGGGHRGLKGRNKRKTKGTREKKS